ncbi:LysR substrate-binding domain-containing protein [Salinicola sp. DM10]|uniref:LysR substrate-binding domain-containing protein n=1 Tax=Salinicola sp. DM10 TaxID=2815721 RepID=UPI001A8F2718|nr:LysR substrate-binding domain-containing protein [Salinicola sp. DM10]MCE3028291.1 LysR substrate-binding domain-containing protein [Salinicola sp. DM10]
MHALSRSLPPLAALLPFEAAARLESFTRAAEELHLTQAAISRQIRALERDLGVALFERRNRGVFLTPAGRELAHTLSENLGQIGRHADAIRGGERGHRVILFCQLCEAFYWLMPRLADFHRRHPEIDLKLITSTRPLSEQRDPFDVALQTHGRPSGGHALAFTASDTILPVCSPAHPAAQQAPLAPAALTTFELLHHQAEPAEWMGWRDWFEAMGEAPPAELGGKRFDSYPLLLQAALSGHGIALGWARTTQRLIAAGELITPVDERFFQPDAIGIYVHRTSTQRYASRALLGWLEDALQQEG